LGLLISVRLLRRLLHLSGHLGGKHARKLARNRLLRVIGSAVPDSPAGSVRLSRLLYYFFAPLHAIHCFTS
jgi:hypothetical protein